VPEENAFAIGDGDLIISKDFTWSGPVAAIAAVAVARTAYEYALDWAKTHTAGGDKPIINHQAVGYLLADVAMQIEACRAFSWKAAHYLDKFDSDGHAIGAMSKIYCGEMMFEAVFKCMQVVGVAAVDKALPLEKCLREAVVFPLYDAGNVGMQRRKVWGVMADPGHAAAQGLGRDGRSRLQPARLRGLRGHRVQEVDGGLWHHIRSRVRRNAQILTIPATAKVPAGMVVSLAGRRLGAHVGRNHLRNAEAECLILMQWTALIQRHRNVPESRII
jgi:hypothetical protein